MINNSQVFPKREFLSQKMRLSRFQVYYDIQLFLEEKRRTKKLHALSSRMHGSIDSKMFNSTMNEQGLSKNTNERYHTNHKNSLAAINNTFDDSNKQSIQKELQLLSSPKIIIQDSAGHISNHVKGFYIPTYRGSNYQSQIRGVQKSEKDEWQLLGQLEEQRMQLREHQEFLDKKKKQSFQKQLLLQQISENSQTKALNYQLKQLELRDINKYTFADKIYNERLRGKLVTNRNQVDSNQLHAELIRQKEQKLQNINITKRRDRENWIEDDYFKYFSYDYQAQLKKARQRIRMSLNQEYKQKSLDTRNTEIVASLNSQESQRSFMENRKNFLDQGFDNNEKLRQQLNNKKQVIVDMNENIYKQKMPKLVKLEHEQYQSEIKANEEYAVRDKAQLDLEQFRVQASQDLTLKCKESQRQAILSKNNSRFQVRSKDLQFESQIDIKPENLSLNWDNMGRSKFKTPQRNNIKEYESNMINVGVVNKSNIDITMNKHERSMNKDLLKEAMIKFNIGEDDMKSSNY
ncbi:UNKNOWN [Stylonychia lemnae]|uniref:Uncharacterized protein n=1 Tax=Stylonychia lemnae TaxID=5949 RepID=A0A078AV39_STYLE|nr:UNKNOWN [Stylonychia lemnae]|eukprot:CDW84728.1 UNKNOWN [Stylonychia lemnae]